MSRIVQQMRHGTVEADAYVGPSGQITVDTEQKNLRLHDGVTPGGSKLPNETAIGGFNFRFFGAVVAMATPGQLLVANVANRMGVISVAGDYLLPAFSDFTNVGTPILFFSQVPGVNIKIKPASGDLITDHGVDADTVAMSQWETILLTPRAAQKFHTILRY